MELSIEKTLQQGVLAHKEGKLPKLFAVYSCCIAFQI